MMKKALKIDWIILICCLSLLGIGLFTLYSLTDSSIHSRIDFQQEFTSQLIFALIGVILSTVVFSISPIYFRFKILLAIIYIITLILLVYTAFYGLRINGARRWISIGSQVLENGTIVGGVTIQASEFAKVAIIILTSALLSTVVSLSGEAKTQMHKLKRFLIENKYTFISIFLNLTILAAIIAQNSLSVAVIVMTIILTLIFANIRDKLSTFLFTLIFAVALYAGQDIFFSTSILIRGVILGSLFGLYVISIYSKKLNEKIVLVSIIAGLLFGAVGLNLAWNYVLKGYQRDRIEAKLNPKRDSSKEGFQPEQAKISIGAGQIFGQGFRQISESRLLLLPEPTTDFIFAIFSYKFGFVGAFTLIMLYIALITRLFYLADHMNDRFGSLVLTGVATMILVQFFVNIGMNLDILPVGGTTLPFVSAGGSSLISMMLALALCQNVIATCRVEKNIHRRKDKVLIEGWNTSN